jgi:rare lipoprotein A
MQGGARLVRIAAVAAGAASLAACASVEPKYPTAEGVGPHVAAGGAKVGPPYQVNGIWYVPRDQPNYDEVGTASWYGDAFHGRSTADGEIFDMNVASAAHTTLPLPSIVEVTNLENGRKLQVRVNDRGPFVGDRIIDLSREAARQLGYDRQGLARVRVRYVGPAPLLGPDAGVRIARAGRPAQPERYAGERYASERYASAGPARPIPYAALLKPAAPASDAAFVSRPAPTSARQLTIIPAVPAASGPAAAPSTYRVQAAAFSEEARARRVAAQLGGLGAARVESTVHDGQMLYRVVVDGPADEAQADSLRARVAAAGFADARVIGPF